MASSSRARSSSPFSYRKPSSPYSSTSSSSSFSNPRPLPRSCSSSANSFYNSTSGNAFASRSMSDTLYSGSLGYHCHGAAVGFSASDELIVEPLDTQRSADSISVTIRFRPLSEREYQRGDEIAWSADGDNLVRNEYNPSTAYPFDKVFGPHTTSQEVYEVAAKPVVKAAMEGVNGTVFAYGVTSSGKTHTMHGDHNCPGVIPLAIKDVFSIIQDTPGREFLLRVSYLEIYNEVINDLLDPTGQNLRVREDAQGTYVEGIKEEVVLSPGHALSFIAAGEEHRHVGSNNFNLLSSRSHTIFTLPENSCIASEELESVCCAVIIVSGRNAEATKGHLDQVSLWLVQLNMIESSAPGDEYDGVIFSQLNLIDLAGSESSKTETTGLRRKEGSYINKSLLTLGTVIGKLSEGKASHVPYRDSKLTRLLQSSLSGRGHVSLICTVTPASSNMEETHNTLKFASRAKRVEIFASRNKIIDEKSLIKKYQREISNLKQELDQLRRGMLVGVSHEEILNLRQQLEEGQVKMQTRLEEEEEAKAALMSRIQRLTKLILVSSKNAIPDSLGDIPSHQRSHSAGEDEKCDAPRDCSLVIDGGNQKDFPISDLVNPSDVSYECKHKRSSSKRSEELSPTASIISESIQAGELICGTKLPGGGISASDQLDLLVEQVKVLAGEIAFGTSTMKRLIEQSVDGSEGSKLQIQNLEREIQEKKRQMRVLEHRIIESGEASIENASLVEMQQTVTRLMARCNEKGFELEIMSADNRILQEQLQNKCSENRVLLEKVNELEWQLASVSSDKTVVPHALNLPNDYIEELEKKVQIQEIENEKLKQKHGLLSEENSGLRVQSQKLAEEASYAKELASAAAVELKNLAAEVTKLSLQNSKLEKELQSTHETAHSKANGFNRKFNDVVRGGKRGRLSGRVNNITGVACDNFDTWTLDSDELKVELQARKQREAALESALAEKDFLEDEYRKKVEEAKKREEALENDLANMWILVAKLKKDGGGVNELNSDEKCNGVDLKPNEVDCKDVLGERQISDVSVSAEEPTKEETLVVRLKARLQEMKEKELKAMGNGDGNSHICKVCFESPTATILLPCRHFCLCKSCSLACSECPICRTKIGDRLFAFSS